MTDKKELSTRFEEARLRRDKINDLFGNESSALSTASKEYSVIVSGIAEEAIQAEISGKPSRKLAALQAQADELLRKINHLERVSEGYNLAKQRAAVEYSQAEIDYQTAVYAETWPQFEQVKAEYFQIRESLQDLLTRYHKLYGQVVFSYKRISNQAEAIGAALPEGVRAPQELQFKNQAIGITEGMIAGDQNWS